MINECAYCGESKGSLKFEDGIGICRYCYESITGKSISPDSYAREYSRNGIVIWIKDEEIKHVWLKDGDMAIPYSFWKDKDIKSLILELRDLQRKDIKLSGS